MRAVFLGDVNIAQDMTFTFDTVSLTPVDNTETFESGLVLWQNVAGDQRDWTRQTGSTPSSSTGPTGAHAGSWYVFAETSSPAATSDKYWLETVADHVCGGDLTFYYHMYGLTTGTLNVRVSTNAGASWSAALWTKSGQQQTATSDPYTLATVNLSAYVGQTVRLRIEYIRGTSFTGDTAIDAITYQTLVSTPGTTDVTLTAGSWFASAYHMWHYVLTQINLTVGVSYAVTLDTDTRVLTVTGSPVCVVPDLADIGYTAGSQTLGVSAALAGVFSPVWPLISLSHGVTNLTGYTAAAQDGTGYTLAGASQETCSLSVSIDKRADDWAEYTAWVYMWHTYWLRGRYVTVYVDSDDCIAAGTVGEGVILQFGNAAQPVHTFTRLVENKYTQDQSSMLAFAKKRNMTSAWTIR